MSEPTPPDDVVVVVVRTGGIAGIRRHWQVQRPGPDAGPWLSLIDRCPWDTPSEGRPMPDRYVWSIQARTPTEKRERELADSELTGAWHDLVTAVREAGRAEREP